MHLFHGNMRLGSIQDSQTVVPTPPEYTEGIGCTYELMSAILINKSFSSASAVLTKWFYLKQGIRNG